MTETEAERIEQAIAGDPAALDRLLLDSYEPLTAHIGAQLPADLRRLIGVDDIVQLVYSQAFRGIREFEVRGDGCWISWLKAISDNRIRDALRAERAKKRGGDFRQLISVGKEGSPFVESLVGEYATTTATPSREVARGEAIKAIQVAIAGLPEENREVVQLRYFEDCPVDEIARRLDKSPGAVRGLLDRSKQKIRESLQSASRYLSSR